MKGGIFLNHVVVSGKNVFLVSYESDEYFVDGEEFTSPEFLVIKEELGTVAEALVRSVEKNLSLLREFCPEVWQAASTSPISPTEGLYTFLGVDSLEAAANAVGERIMSVADVSDVNTEQRRLIEEFIDVFPTVMEIYGSFSLTSELVALGVGKDMLSKNNSTRLSWLAMDEERFSCTLGVLNDGVEVYYSPRPPKEYLKILLFEYFKSYKDIQRIGVCALCKKMFVRKNSNAVTCSKECSRINYEKQKRKTSSFYKIARNYSNRLVSAADYLPPKGTDCTAEQKEVQGRFEQAVEEWNNRLDKIKDDSKKERRYMSFCDDVSAKTVGDVDKFIADLPTVQLEDDMPSIFYIEQMRRSWKELDLENLCRSVRKCFRKERIMGEP